MASIKFKTVGANRTFQAGDSAPEGIFNVEKLKAVGNLIMFRFGGEDHPFSSEDDIEIEEEAFEGTPSEVIEKLLTDFFLEASGTGGIAGDGISNIVYISQAAYDALVTKDSETIYVI